MKLEMKEKYKENARVDIQNCFEYIRSHQKIKKDHIKHRGLSLKRICEN